MGYLLSGNRRAPHQIKQVLHNQQSNTADTRHCALPYQTTSTDWITFAVHNPRGPVPEFLHHRVFYSKYWASYFDLSSLFDKGYDKSINGALDFSPKARSIRGSGEPAPPPFFRSKNLKIYILHINLTWSPHPSLFWEHVKMELKGRKLTVNREIETLKS